MTNIVETSKSPEFIFRCAIFELLDSLSLDVEPEYYRTVLERLDSSFESFPANEISDSKKFFNLVSMMIFEELRPYYEITSADVTRGNSLKTVYNFMLRDSQREIQDIVSSYRNKSRFFSAFLPRYNQEFYRYFRNLRQDNYLFRHSKSKPDGSFEYIPYRFDKSKEVLLPTDTSGSVVGTGYRIDSFRDLIKIVNLDMKYYLKMNERHGVLLEAIESFEEDLRDHIIKGYRQLGERSLQQLLSELVIPVDSIVNEEVVRLCKEENRKLFVLTPSPERLIPLGSSVYVYSSHDLADDSSYIIKPILISEETPADTEELKFLGIGQVSAYDTTSPRSRGGESPYVINGNIYTKAIWQDFECLFPDELVSHMKSCERILHTADLDQEELTVDKTEHHVATLQKLNDFKLTGREIIIGTYLTAMAENDIKEQNVLENERKKQEPFIFKMKKRNSLSENISKSIKTNISYEDNAIYSFSLADTDSFNLQLFRRKLPHYESIAIFYDYEDSAFYAARLNEASNVEVCKTTTGEEACRALSLSTGVYTVYAYGRRGHHPSLAMYSVYSHQEQPEVQP